MAIEFPILELGIVGLVIVFMWRMGITITNTVDRLVSRYFTALEVQEAQETRTLEIANNAMETTASLKVYIEENTGIIRLLKDELTTELRDLRVATTSTRDTVDDIHKQQRQQTIQQSHFSASIEQLLRSTSGAHAAHTALLRQIDNKANDILAQQNSILYSQTAIANGWSHMTSRYKNARQTVIHLAATVEEGRLFKVA